MVLTETWVEEKDWRNISRNLPRGYVWGTQWASRKNRKGRAMGGMIMEIRKEMIEKGTKIEADIEGFVVGRVKKGGERWRIVGVYVREGMEKAMKEMEQWMEEK